MLLFFFKSSTKTKQNKKADVVKLCYKPKQSEGSGLETTPTAQPTVQASGPRLGSLGVKGTGSAYWWKTRFTNSVIMDKVFNLCLTQLSHVQKEAWSRYQPQRRLSQVGAQERVWRAVRAQER